jgi:prolyl 4-hydroxylase
VAILATAALTASCANETHQQQPNVEDEDDPSYIRKLHHLLPSFLFASAEEQAGRQEMMQAPPSKSFKSRICGAGSNADLDGTCASSDDNDDDDTDGGDGSGSNVGEEGHDGESEEEEEDGDYTQIRIEPEACVQWVTEDPSRCLHPERRPLMLGECAEACRDIAGITARDLTEEQLYEDAANGYLYYYPNDEEGKAEEEEHECIDHDERCAEYIYDNHGCWHNFEFMKENCAKSCYICYSDNDLTVFRFGVKQMTNYHYEDDTNAAIRENIEETAEYMLNQVMWEDRFENVRNDCYNFDPKCSFYAAQGWCENSVELRWMQETCGPACQACMTIDYWHRCGSKPDMEDAIEEGGMVALFERIIDNYPHDKLSILSYPERRKDFLDSRGLKLTQLEPAVDYTALGYDYFNDWIEKEKDWIEDLEHETPYVLTLDNFLTDEECDFFIKEGYRLGFKESSKVADMGDEYMTTGEDKFDSGRTSRNTFCASDCYESEINMAVMNRMEALTGIPKENSEDLQLLKYEVDERYEEHHDSIWSWAELFCGHRIFTIFLYLNDVEEGGETRLNALNIDVKPKKGMALIWPSVRDDDLTALEDWGWHEAQPVKKGQKFGANAWFRSEWEF